MPSPTLPHPAALVPATAADLPAITALLAEARLPFADLTPAHLDGFVVARDGGGALVGAGGLEVYAGGGLLRSLVVAPAARGTGLGGALVAALEAEAARRGLPALYLLTTTAEPFFAARGYARLDRAAVPASVRASAEFAHLCPASAACMGKPLPGG